MNLCAHGTVNRYANGSCKICKRAWNWKRYNINMSESLYNYYMVIQHGRCAICFRPPHRNRLAVDHNHETGVIRGLLCVRCNNTLGQIEKNPTLFKTMVDYVTRDFVKSIQEAA